MAEPSKMKLAIAFRANDLRPDEAISFVAEAAGMGLVAEPLSSAKKKSWNFEGTVKQALAEISRDFNVCFQFDGNTLHAADVTSSTFIFTQGNRRNSAFVKRARSVWKELFPWQSENAVRYLPDLGAVQLCGTRPVIDLAKQVLPLESGHIEIVRYAVSDQSRKN